MKAERAGLVAVKKNERKRMRKNELVANDKNLQPTVLDQANSSLFDFDKLPEETKNELRKSAFEETIRLKGTEASNELEQKHLEKKINTVGDATGKAVCDGAEMTAIMKHTDEHGNETIVETGTPGRKRSLWNKIAGR